MKKMLSLALLSLSLTSGANLVAAATPDAAQIIRQAREEAAQKDAETRRGVTATAGSVVAGAAAYDLYSTGYISSGLSWITSRASSLWTTASEYVAPSASKLLSFVTSYSAPYLQAGLEVARNNPAVVASVLGVTAVGGAAYGAYKSSYVRWTLGLLAVGLTLTAFGDYAFNNGQLTADALAYASSLVAQFLGSGIDADTCLPSETPEAAAAAAICWEHEEAGLAADAALEAARKAAELAEAEAAREAARIALATERSFIENAANAFTSFFN